MCVEITEEEIKGKKENYQEGPSKLCPFLHPHPDKTAQYPMACCRERCELWDAIREACGRKVK